MKGQPYFYLMSSIKKPLLDTFDKYHVFAKRLLNYPEFCDQTKIAHIYTQNPKGIYVYRGTVKG